MRYLAPVLLLLFLAVASAAPTASIVANATAFTGEPVLIDGSASTNVNGQVGWSTTPFADGTVPVAFDFGDGLGAASKMVILKCVHTYLMAGSYTISLTVKDAAGVTASTTKGIVISDIPAAVGGGIQTLTNQGSAGANCTALQNAINTAFAVNTVEQEIRLPAAVTYQCSGVSLTIPAAAGGKYVTIRPTSIAWLPSALKRVVPGDSSNMPLLLTPGSGASILYMAGANRHHLRLIGLEFKESTYSYNQLDFSTVGPTLGTAPHDVIIDHCYIHGLPSTDSGRGIWFNVKHASVLNSYFAEFHTAGQGGLSPDPQEVQAIGGCDTPGEHSILNNYLEAYGENYMLGGCETNVAYSSTASAGSTTSCTLSSVTDLTVGQPISFTVGGVKDYTTTSIVRSISGSVITYDAISGTPDTTVNAVKYGIIPQDIEFRRNYIFKQLVYWPDATTRGAATYNGYHPQVKNSFELKYAMRVVVDGNVIKNNWADAQNGFTVLVTNRSGNTSPWMRIQDVQFTNNKIQSIPNFINILGINNPDAACTPFSNCPSGESAYLYFANNLADDMRGDYYTPPSNTENATTLQFAARIANFVTFVHNTTISSAATGKGVYVQIEAGPSVSNFVFENNIGMNMQYGVYGSGLSAGNATLNPNAPGSLFHHNVMSAEVDPVWFPQQYTSPYVPNYFPATIDTLTFINRAAGDYHLSGSSPYRAAGATPASDGTDIGVNFDTLSAAILNTVSGDWTAGAPIVCKWPNAQPVCN